MIKNPWYGKYEEDDNERYEKQYKTFTKCLDTKKEKDFEKEIKSYPCITRKATPEEIEKAFEERK